MILNHHFASFSLNLAVCEGSAVRSLRFLASLIFFKENFLPTVIFDKIISK